MQYAKKYNGGAKGTRVTDDDLQQQQQHDEDDDDETIWEGSCCSANGGRHYGRTTADSGGPTGVRGRPVDRGRGVMPGGRGVRVARARDDGTPRGRSGGRGGHHAAAAGQLSVHRRGRHAAAQEQAGRDDRTVLVPTR